MGCSGHLHCNLGYRFCNPDSKALSLDAAAPMLPLSPIGHLDIEGKMESLDWITRLSPWTWLILAVAASIVALLWVVGEDQ